MLGRELLKVVKTWPPEKEEGRKVVMLDEFIQPCPLQWNVVLDEVRNAYAVHAVFFTDRLSELGGVVSSYKNKRVIMLLL